jgi:hypothetical protein
MIFIFSSCCEAADEEGNARNHKPSFGAGDGGFEVLGKAAVAAGPSKGPFDHPASRFGFEASDILRTRDNLDRPFSTVGNCIE